MHRSLATGLAMLLALLAPSLAAPAGATGEPDPPPAEEPAGGRSAPGEASREGNDRPAADPGLEAPPLDAEPVAAAPAPASPATLGGTTVPPVRPRAAEGAGRGAIELGGGPPTRGRWRGAPITLSLRDAPLPEVLRSFARLAGVNLVLDSRVQGAVTVELVEVPWDQALHVILKTHGMGAEIDGRVWLIAPR